MLAQPASCLRTDSASGSSAQLCVGEPKALRWPLAMDMTVNNNHQKES